MKILLILMAIALGAVFGISVVGSQQEPARATVEMHRRLVVRAPDGKVAEDYSTKETEDGTTIRDGGYMRYEDGILKDVGVYRDDQPTGPRLILWNEGMPFALEQRDSNGVMNGESIKWYRPGLVMGRSLFIDGIQKGAARTYYASGAKRNYYHLDGGQNVGPVIRWRENGELESIAYLIAPDRLLLKIEFSELGDTDAVQVFDIASGEITLSQGWHGNGIRSFEYSYQAGEPHGLWLDWNESGKLTTRRRFESGRLVE